MAGLLVFFFDINAPDAYALLAAAILGVIVYLVLTVVPILSPDCPYTTPLTPGIRPIYSDSMQEARRTLGRAHVPSREV